MLKIRYGTSSKKGLIRSQAFPKINKINIKRLIAATVPSGGSLTPGFLWVGPSEAGNTMWYYPFGFEDTDEYWTYNIQHNSLPRTSPFWINRNNLVGKRVKINNPIPNTALELAISGQEFEIIGTRIVEMWGNQLNVTFKVPKSFMPIKIDWQWGDPRGKTFSIYSETDLGYLGGTNGIPTPPAFTLSRSSNNATVGSAAMGFNIYSTGGHIDSYRIQQSYAGQLYDVTPPDMNFNTSTGALSGTPLSAQENIDYIITATNSAGTATQTFNWTSTYQEYQLGDITPDNMMIVYDAGHRGYQNTWGRYLAVAPENWWNENVIEGSKDPLMHLTYLPIPGTTLGYPDQNASGFLGKSLENTQLLYASHDQGQGGAGAVTIALQAGNGWFVPSSDAIRLIPLERPWMTSDYEFKATGRNVYLTSTEYTPNILYQNVAVNMTDMSLEIYPKDHSVDPMRLRPMRFVI